MSSSSVVLASAAGTHLCQALGKLMFEPECYIKVPPKCLLKFRFSKMTTKKKILTFIENLSFSKLEISDFNAMRPEIETLHRKVVPWQLAQLHKQVIQQIDAVLSAAFLVNFDHPVHWSVKLIPSKPATNLHNQYQCIQKHKIFNNKKLLGQTNFNVQNFYLLLENPFEFV